jgi:hypothetical protein
MLGWKLLKYAGKYGQDDSFKCGTSVESWKDIVLKVKSPGYTNLLDLVMGER